jgi:repressor of nif and glnA expression
MVPVFSNQENIKRKALLILSILNEEGRPLGSCLIALKMEGRELMSNELAVRCHLRIMDEKGITRLVGKMDGRAITAMGINEIDDARVQDKIGFVISRIYYSGTSLDPSEAFIRAKMTSVREVSEKGEGKILANFREVPALCRSVVEKILPKLKSAGISGVMTTGKASEPICQVPVDVNKLGVILIGGLNPVACAQEAGIEGETRAMSSVMEYQELRKFSEVCREKW